MDDQQGGRVLIAGCDLDRDDLELAALPR